MEPDPTFPIHEPAIIRIGDIDVTSSTIRTPAGEFALRGSEWHITDQWTVEQKIPQWAIVMAIVGFCCLTVFSLLFLLAKETIYHGAVTVTVTSGPHQYVSRIQVISQAHVQQIYGQVNYARSLALV